VFDPFFSGAYIHPQPHEFSGRITSLDASIIWLTRPEHLRLESADCCTSSHQCHGLAFKNPHGEVTGTSRGKLAAAPMIPRPWMMANLQGRVRGCPDFDFDELIGHSKSRNWR